MTKKVMIVDDEAGIRLAVRAVLESRGFDVLPVESGQKCIEELERGFRGVIIMDIMMPEMDGWTTIREIEKRGLMEGNVISMLTAKEAIDADLQELTSSVRYYMWKPFESEELASIVDEYCSVLEETSKAAS